MNPQNQRDHEQTVKQLADIIWQNHPRIRYQIGFDVLQSRCRNFLHETLAGQAAWGEIADDKGK